ncbi:hypothetical protein [Streptomyces sp. B21-101]|uniref:hypothetical protein n=1 Tax=Streptomyces sp. B21-101 TaxID=3039415 RepID=UPI002FF2352E
MTMTPEQARTEANKQLAALYANVTDWDRAILDQVVLAIAGDGQPFSMNDIRTIVPEDACRNAGLYFHALVNTEHPVILQPVGEVRSINKKAHGKKVNTYRLTRAGRKFLEDRQAARIEQKRAAA